ncbi:MAG: acyl--CoA ligase [Deltaproteobacteria bacterium]|nr:acyl--CoA ligase [Deltaproteobacteria bacterium]
MFLFDMLRADAETHPDKPAAIFPDDRITFSQLHQRSDHVAAALAARGVGPGDRVAILCDNGLPPLVYFWGILKTGAQTVDMPTLAGQAVLQGILDEAQPRALVIDPKQLGKLGGGLELPELVLTYGDGEQAATEHGLTVLTLDAIESQPAAAAPIPAISPDDVAMIVYTSGTTGRPNGVMLSHENFISNLRASNELMGLTSDDSILVVVPLYYIHGRMQLLLHALIGGHRGVQLGVHVPGQGARRAVRLGGDGAIGRAVPLQAADGSLQARRAPATEPPVRAGDRWRAVALGARAAAAGAAERGHPPRLRPDRGGPAHHVDRSEGAAGQARLGRTGAAGCDRRNPRERRASGRPQPGGRGRGGRAQHHEGLRQRRRADPREDRCTRAPADR